MPTTSGMRIVASVLVLAAATFVSATAAAGERWAAPTALRSSGPCLAVDPCTLSAALTGAATGDEILLAAGRYELPAPLTAPVRVTLRGAAPERPVIVGNETSGDHAVLTFKTGGTLRHVEIRAEQGEQDALELRGGITEDVVLFSTGGNGAEVFGAPDGTVLRDALARTAAADTDRAALRLREDVGDVMLRNVTALAPEASGIRCSVMTGTATFVNTIARGARDIRASAYNRCTASFSNFRPTQSPHVRAGSGNQQGEPLLRNDGRPILGSPTIDAGRTDTLLGATDLAGCPRTVGAAPDIGAFEYVDATCALVTQNPPPTAEVTPTPTTTPEPPISTPTPIAHDTEAEVPPGVPAPVQGTSVVVSPGRGTVLIRVPGTNRFRELEAGAQLPVGTEVDAREGRVTLVTAVAGGLQDGTFGGARFKIGQQRSGDGMTSLVMTGESFKGCSKRVRASAAAASKKKPVRRLWARDKNGRFRTHGHNSVATARGTRWVTTDSCAGTRTTVFEGAVAVRDKRRKRTTLVRAGDAYLVPR